MPHSGYTYELVAFNIGTLLLLISLLSQLLVYRFTSHYRWHLAKLRLIKGATLVTIFLIIRNIDPSNVFNVMPFATTHAISLQATACLLHCSALVLLGALRSLSHLIHRRIPPWIVYTLFGMTLGYHLMAVSVSIMVWIMYSPQMTEDQIFLVLRIRDVTYDTVALSLLLLAWYSFGRLFYLTRMHVRRMREQESMWMKRDAEEATTTRRSEGASDGSNVATENGGEKTRKNTTSTQIILVAPAEIVPITSYSPQPGTPTQQRQQQQPPTYPTFSSPISPSSSAARIAELDAAASKLGRFIFITSLVVLFSVSSIFFEHGNYRVDDFKVQDDRNYTMNRCSTPCIQYAATFLVLWFAWTSPRVWMQSKSPFWMTLIHGLPMNENGRVQVQPIRRQGKYPLAKVGKNLKRVADSSLLPPPAPTALLDMALTACVIPTPSILPLYAHPPLRVNTGDTSSPPAVRGADADEVPDENIMVQHAILLS